MGPIGAVIPFAGATAPSGWLLCNGQLLNTTTYSALHAVLLYSYGGSGSSFGVPDLRGRVVAGFDNMGGSSISRLSSSSWTTTMNGSGGAPTHQLSSGEMPSHFHSTVAYGYFNAYVANQAINALQNYGQGQTNTGSAGSSQAHNNIQPTMVMNYIIFAGV